MARLDTSGELNARTKAQVPDGSQQLGAELKQSASASAQAARQKLSEKSDELTQKALSLSEQQKSIGAQQLGSIASAVHTAAGELELNMPQAANYVHAAAAKVESAATALRERRIDELLSDIGDLARERPWLVFGGAVLAGFAVSRFVKSTSDGRSEGVMTDTRLESQSQTPAQGTTAGMPATGAATANGPNFMPNGDTMDRSFEGTA